MRIADNTLTVRGLIEKLQQFDPDAEVVGTWEGTSQTIDVYAAADGCVMVDADMNSYKEQWQKGVRPCT